jgi:hypothetical protein
MFKHLKITKRSLKSPGTVEEALRNCGAVAARLPTRGRHWRRVGSVIASSPLHFPCRWRPAKTTTNATTVDFSFIIFGSASPPSPFHIRCISASFLFPLLLFQVAGGMTKDCRSVGVAELLLPLEAVRRLRKERPAG